MTKIGTLEQLTKTLSPIAKVAMERAIDHARAKAESEIERILARLEHATMCKIGSVEVNADYTKGCTVEVFFKLDGDSLIR